MIALLDPKIVSEVKSKQTVDSAVPCYLNRPGESLLNWMRPYSRLWRKCVYCGNAYLAMGWRIRVSYPERDTRFWKNVKAAMAPFDVLSRSYAGE